MSSDIREFRDRIICENRNYADMNDPQEKIRHWMLEELSNLGHGAKGKLATVLGVRPDAITRMTNLDPSRETREVKAHELVQMQEFFGSLAPDHIQQAVPIMGYVGAGAEVEPEHEQVPSDGLDQIDVPFPLPPDMIGFEVRGISMLPRYDEGDVIIVWKEQKRGIDSFLGEEAAVRTSDGRRFLKTIQRGEQGYTLVSWNDHPILGQEIAWVGEIYVTIRANQLKRAAKKIERQGGIQGRLRLT